MFKKIITLSILGLIIIFSSSTKDYKEFNNSEEVVTLSSAVGTSLIDWTNSKVYTDEVSYSGNADDLLFSGKILNYYHTWYTGSLDSNELINVWVANIDYLTTGKSMIIKFGTKTYIYDQELTTTNLSGFVPEENNDDCVKLQTGDNFIDTSSYLAEGKTYFSIFYYESSASSTVEAKYKPTLTVKVAEIDETSPDIEFDGESTSNLGNGDIVYLYFDIENPVTLDSVKEMFGAYDDYDGLLTDDLEFVTSYNPNDLEINGVYDVLVSVSDSSGNSSSATLKLVAKDITKPIITSAYTTNPFQTIKLSEYSSIDSLKTKFSSIDTFLNDPSFSITDYDKNLTYDIDTSNLSLDLDNVASQKQYITITATDSSGNANSTNVAIEVVDDVSPSVSLSTSSVTHKYGEIIDEATIKGYITASDNVFDLSNLTIDVDLSSYKNNVVGTYTIAIKVSDKANNSTSVNFVINVVDEDIPIIFTNNQYISLTDLATIEEIIYIIEAMYLDLFPDVIDNYSLVSVTSDYFEVVGLGGEYEVIATFKSLTTDESYVDVITLNISDTTTSNDPVIESVSDVGFFLSVWRKIKDFFLSGFYFIKNIFFNIIEFF